MFMPPRLPSKPLHSFTDLICRLSWDVSHATGYRKGRQWRAERLQCWLPDMTDRIEFIPTSSSSRAGRG